MNGGVPVNATGIIFLVLAIVLNAMANILMKASAIHRSEDASDLLFNPWMLGGLASFGLAFIAYRQALMRGLPLSIGYPVMTTAGLVIILAASYLVFKERLDVMQWAGIACLFLGIWLIAGRMS